MANTKVTSRVLANDAVLTANIADDQVTTAKIADDQITSALVADDLALGGNPTTTTQSAGNNTTRIATTAFVTTAVANLADSAPDALNTLNELAAALGDDANFSTTVTNSIATKAPLSAPTFTGDVDIDATDDLRLRFLNGSTFKGGIQVPTSSGDMISGSAVDDLAIRSQGNILFSSGGNTEHMRIQSGKVGIGTPSPEGVLHVHGGDSGSSYTADGADKLIIEHSDSVAIDLRTPASNQALIMFSDGTRSQGLIGYNHSNDSLRFSNSGNQTRMLIKSDGNVGIGITDPATTLHLDASGGAVMRLQRTSANATNKLELSHDGTNAQITSTNNLGISATQATFDGTVLIDGLSNYTGLTVKGSGGSRPMIQWSNANNGALCAIYGTEGNDMVLTSGSSNTERMRISSDGYVGIGEDNPSLKLMVQENDASKQVLMVRNQASTVSSSTAALVYLQYNGDSSLGDGSKFIHFVDSDTNLGQIVSANSSTGVSYGSNSDERLKKNIVDASSQLDVVKSVKVREYDWKKNDKHELGFIAQELKTSIPQAVIEGGDDETVNPWGVDYGRVTPYLVKAIQEQQVLIEALQKEVEELKGG